MEVFCGVPVGKLRRNELHNLEVYRPAALTLSGLGGVFTSHLKPAHNLTALDVRGLDIRPRGASAIAEVLAGKV